MLHARFSLRRLYIPHGTPCRLQLDLEQVRDLSNCVVLTNERDRFERRVPRVTWRVTQPDRDELMRVSAELRSRYATASGVAANCERESARSLKPYDAYHPVGTCRLGRDANAVVDPDLRLRGTENIYVVSTAVLPTAGSANPTLALLCFAEDIANRLTTPIKEMRRRVA
jgi:choline dehydrogenase-like flavoprotein